jgi:hypothetical protein
VVAISWSNSGNKMSAIGMNRISIA